MIRSIAILLAFVAGTAFPGTVSARSLPLIRDAEIERAIRAYSAPVFSAIGVAGSDVRVHIVNNRRLNAFVAGGRHIDVEIGHVFRDFGAPTARVILPTPHYVSRFPADAVRWRRLAVLADSDALDRLTATLAERFGAANTRNQASIRAVAMDVFDRTFLVSRSLTSVALAVAVLGLYAALTAVQASREREFRLLSAIGYGRAETWRLAVAHGGQDEAEVRLAGRRRQAGAYRVLRQRGTTLRSSF
jgi:hypothetical protein